MNYDALTPEQIRLRLAEIAATPCTGCRVEARHTLKARVRFEIEVGVCPDGPACLAAIEVGVCPDGPACLAAIEDGSGYTRLRE